MGELAVFESSIFETRIEPVWTSTKGAASSGNCLRLAESFLQKLNRAKRDRQRT